MQNVLLNDGYCYMSDGLNALLFNTIFKWKVLLLLLHSLSCLFSSISFLTKLESSLALSDVWWGRRCRCRCCMVVGFTEVVRSNPVQARCTRYNIMWYSLSVTCDMSVVFSRDSGFLHQLNWSTRYNWNIIESGVKHHNPNPDAWHYFYISRKIL